MRSAVLTLILLALNLLCACTAPIPREQFKRELVQVASDNVQLYKYFNKPFQYSDSEYQEMLKNILSDEVIVTAIYDYAENSQRASSVATILSTDWVRAFQRKGMLFLSDEDKKLFLEKIGSSLANMPTDKCEESLRKEVMDIVITGVDKKKVGKISLYALKSGAIVYDRLLEPPDKSKLGVALVALLVKAKENMTDDEIERYVKMVIERKPLLKEDICPLISRLAFFATELEPKYRNILFDRMIFLHRSSL